MAFVSVYVLIWKYRVQLVLAVKLVVESERVLVKQS